MNSVITIANKVRYFELVVQVYADIVQNNA